MATLTIEEIDKAIAKATEYQSMTVDGESVTNQSLASLLKLREQLLQEEAQKTRVRFATFDLSQQDL